MAGETTTTTLTELVTAEYISPLLQGYLAESNNPAQFNYDLGMVPVGTSTVRLPRLISDMGTVGDGGTGIDTELNASEATALSAIELETEEGSVTIIEYGIYRELSLTALEDNILGGSLFELVLRDATQMLATACNDDVTALYASLTNSSGSTGQNMSVAYFDDAIADLRDRGVKSPGGLVAVLGQQCAVDWENAIKATNAATAIYAAATDRMMRAEFEGQNGMGRPDGYLGSYRGNEIYSTGLVSLANSDADEVSAVYVRGDVPVNQQHATIASAWRRMDLPKTEEDIVKRTVKIVMTRRWGCGLTYASTGQKLITGAT